MIPDLVFREFPAGTLRKHTVSGPEMPGIRRKNPLTVSDYLFWQIPIVSGRNRVNSVTGFIHWNTASMKSQENPGTDRFLARIIVLGRGGRTYQTHVRRKSSKYTHSTAHNHCLGEAQLTMAKFRWGLTSQRYTFRRICIDICENMYMDVFNA